MGNTSICLIINIYEIKNDMYILMHKKQNNMSVIMFSSHHEPHLAF